MAAHILRFFPRPQRRRRPVEREFLPAALEIVESPASPTLRVTALLIAVFLASVVTWSYFGHVDIIATAPGKVIARSRTKVVQPHDASVVRAIHIADGDKVEAGQVLIELDPTMSSADQLRYSDILVQARLDQARLRALLDPANSAAFAGVAAPAELVATAQARLEAEQREQAAKVAKLDHQVAQKHAEQAQIEAEIAKIDMALPLVRERAAIRAEGLKSGYGNKLDLLTQTQQVVELEHQRNVLQRKHDEIDATLAELAALRKQTEAEFRRNALTDLAKADREATEASGELAKATERTRLQTLTAPVAGMVQDLTVHTLGGVVTPAQQLLRIVPSGGGIEVEAVIANQDVGFVELGQEAEIKIETFPFTRYGLIPGHVRAIARDSIDEPQSAQRRQGSRSASDEPGNLERSHQLVYVALIALAETSLIVDGKPLELAPGMAVTAEIKTGKRRVLDYLLSPFHRYSHDVLRER
jgi:HlyD family type I secretion membrane fusion protein